MAHRVAVFSFARKLRRHFSLFHLRSPGFLVPFVACLLLTPAAGAQLQSGFVFASDPNGVAVYTRNDATGVLTSVAGSPFPSKEAVTFLALDFKGRFLFTANNATSKVSMFSVNPNTGALQEVTNSPFASNNTNTPIFLAPEITGQTLYVINFFGSSNLVSSLESFQIDSANGALVPTQTAAVDLPGLYVGGAVHPSGKTFYGYFNNPSPSNPDAASLLVFNGDTGTYAATPFPSGSPALCFAMDPAGLHAVMGSGTNIGQIFTFGLNSDGTLDEFSTSVFVSKPPVALALDALGEYLYVTLTGNGPQHSTVHIYSPITLAELPNSPLPSSITSTASWLVDPSAPLIFADQVYQVSPADGSLSSIFGPSTLAPPAVFSATPGTQPIEGPVAQLSATSFAFGSLSIGSMSSAQTLTITNTGGQNLTLNTLAISGVNASDFSEQDTCHVPTALTPSQSCMATIIFTPSATGPRSASLGIIDNAAPPSEAVALTGTGLSQSSGVTLVPGTLTFGSASSPITVGTSTSSNVGVTNSGGLPLHISKIALSGANSNDFSFSAPNCNATIAANSNCAIAVTFLPLAAGLRSATIRLTDDSPDSPQTIPIDGFASSPVTNSAAVTLVPGALTFGSAAAPIATGTSTSSSITLTNSGAGTLHISNISLTGVNSNEFSFSAPNCNAAIASNSSCSIGVTFLPLAAGLRSATITLTDDAPNSPQAIPISGNAAIPFTFAPAPGASTTATVVAGQPAQYNLQITAGAGYSGIISLTCTGAPLAATCNVPQSVTISSGAAASFAVTVNTTAAHAMLPFPILPHSAPPLNLRLMSLIVFCVLLFFCLILGSNRRGAVLQGRLLGSYSFAGIIFIIATVGFTGCGGTAGTSSAIVTVPPPIFTPAGTSTLVITAAPAAQGGIQLPPQTIQLTLVVN